MYGGRPARGVDHLTRPATSVKKDGTPLDPDTISSYEKVTQDFLDVICRKYPAEVTKQDLKDWMLKLRQGDEAKGRKPVSHRTVCNLNISIACFLRFCGVDHRKLLPQSERPTPVAETPEAYTDEEMTKFFFVITNERDVLAFELMLKTGPREQELANLRWEHLNLGETPTVSYKTREDFRTKTGKSRTIPLERGQVLPTGYQRGSRRTPAQDSSFPRKRAKWKVTSCGSVRSTPVCRARTSASFGYTNFGTHSPLGHYGVA